MQQDMPVYGSPVQGGNAYAGTETTYGHPQYPMPPVVGQGGYPQDAMAGVGGPDSNSGVASSGYTQTSAGYNVQPGSAYTAQLGQSHPVQASYPVDQAPNYNEKPLNAGTQMASSPAPLAANQPALGSSPAREFRAPFKKQFNAMFRKSWAIQKRRKLLNCCLIGAPIAVILLLFALQLVINSLLSSEFTCPDDPATANPQQRSFCALAHPDVFPALWLLPVDSYRGSDSILVTADSSTLASGLAQGMANATAATVASLLAPAIGGFYAALNASVSSCVSTTNSGQVPDTLVTELGQLLAPVTNMTNCPDLEARLPEAVSGSVPSSGQCGSAFALSSSAVVQNYLAGLWGTNLAFGTQAELGVTLYSDGALTVLDADGSISDRPGGNVRLMAPNCTLLPTELQCMVRQLGVMIGAEMETICYDAQARVEPDASAINSKLFDGFASFDAQTPLVQYAGAFNFRDTSTTQLRADVYYNNTNLVTAGDGGGPPRLMRVSAPLNAAVSAFVRAMTGSIDTAGNLAGILEMPKPATSLSLDFASLLGPVFYVWVCQLPFISMVISLVYEKENRLRVIMKMMGLGDVTYWLVTYIYNLVVYFGYMLIFSALGAAIGLNIFRINSFGVQFFFYFLFLNMQIAFAFLWATLLSSTRTTTVVAILWVIGSGLFAGFLVDNFLTSESTSNAVLVVLSLVPPWGFYRGFFELAEYAFQAVYNQTFGLTFDKMDEPRNGMGDVLVIFFLEWLFFLALALYLDQVLGGSGSSVRKHPLFFLGKKFEDDEDQSYHQPAVEVNNELEPQDVVEERMRADRSMGNSNEALVIRGLNKVFPATSVTPAKVAVRDLSIVVSKGECFGLLGPNGAGKSTSFNMLTGFTAPTKGHARIVGLDIAKDLDKIYSQVGVCPQDNILWESLCPIEHLDFYGRIKNLDGPVLSAAIEKALRAVNLWGNGVERKQVGTFSGGMKRRLSVAMAMIGEPQILYLDEPSTGLDPASRRGLWAAILQAKQHAAIVLTTHSMEEAEALCDRLGIFVHGQMRCIGNPKELSKRYGGYYILSLSAPLERLQQIDQYVKQLAPQSEQTYALAGLVKYQIPVESIALTQIFEQFSANASNLGIIDWGIANNTLEEVFLKIAAQYQDAQS